ncbi:MFS transporter [Cuniculiplasma divulgatum]|nr:MFS transporter [Cuniculiplasma divulgatum]MCI2412093.1 MFS transporter [Cuniculiplasma sp.]WMT48701.1 MAG: MFS transporter [Thermoplasmatales archaeon]
MNKYRTSLLASTSFAFIFWGIVGTIGPLAASGSIIGNLNHTGKLIFLLIGSLVVPAGNLSMGILADVIGRKKVFLITMSFYTIGIIVISLSYNVLPLLLGLILAEFGVGGEEPSSLSLVAENTDANKRPFWLTILTNMDNIGSALMAGLFFIVVNNLQDRIVLLIGSLLLILFIVLLRRVIPESQMWLKETGNADESQIEREKIDLKDDGESISQPRLISSFIFLGVIAVSQYLTFGLMAYVLAPIEFPNSSEDDLIIFVALLGSSVAGFIAAPLISRGRKNYTLLSFLFGTVTMVAIFIMVPYLTNMLIFLPLLFANMFMSEFAYASRSVLEPELYGTINRSTLIGLTRLWPMIAYPIFTFYTSTLNLSNFLLINVILWAMGLLASVYWFYFGIETKNANIDYKPVIDRY